MYLFILLYLFIYTIYLFIYLIISISADAYYSKSYHKVDRSNDQEPIQVGFIYLFIKLVYQEDIYI